MTGNISGSLSGASSASGTISGSLSVSGGMALPFGGIDQEIDEIQSEIDALSERVQKTNVAFATCNTGASNPIKIANIVNNNSFYARDGAIIIVYFSFTNTAGPCKLGISGGAEASSYYIKHYDLSVSDGHAGKAGIYTMYFFANNAWNWLVDSEELPVVEDGILFI